MARIWRREGLEGPHKQKKPGRLWLNNSACLRRKPEHPTHVWSCDFEQDQTSDVRDCRALDSLE